MEADLNNYKSRLREMENEITEMSSNYKKVVKDSQDLEKNNEDLLARLKKLEDSKSQSTETSVRRYISNNKTNIIQILPINSSKT